MEKNESSQTETNTAGDKAETAGPGVKRKLNPKDIMGKDIKAVWKDMIQKGLASMDLYTLIGRANNLRTGESDFGPWDSMLGEFEAANLVTGELFISTEAFIPDAAGKLLVNQVRQFITEEIPVTPEQYKKSGKTYRVTGDTVELAIVVSIKDNARAGGQPYEFVVRPIVSVQRSDALTLLRDRAAKFVKALPAPTKLEIPKTDAEIQAATAPKPAVDITTTSAETSGQAEGKKAAAGKK